MTRTVLHGHSVPAGTSFYESPPLSHATPGFPALVLLASRKAGPCPSASRNAGPCARTIRKSAPVRSQNRLQVRTGADS